MDLLLYAVLLVILVVISYKNIKLIKRYSQNKKYIAVYQNILHNDEGCYEMAKEYIAEERKDEFKNKARIIQLYYELDNGIETDDTLSQLNLKDIFYKKGIADKSQINLNSDSFVFIMLTMARAYKVNNAYVLNKLTEKIIELKELENRLEYHEIIAYRNVLTSYEDKGNEFMHKLFNGEYTDYAYEKNMIGLYKRIASSSLVFNNEQFDEFFLNDLFTFAKSLIGENILKSMNLYDRFKVDEDSVKEVEEKTEQ